MDYRAYEKILKQQLSDKRFNHSLRVVDTALRISASFDIDKEKVYLAALLHDYAKDLPPEKLLELGKQNNLVISKVEEKQPDLLHGPVGAWLCREELQVEDEEILQAITYHTTGRVGMTDLDIVVYLADLIEPGRTYKGVEQLREICYKDIGEGLLFAFDATLKYVLKRKLLIHPLTVEARNWCIVSML